MRCWTRGTRLCFATLICSLAGCGDPQKITLDFSSKPVRLVINHEGWPRPFYCPRVNQFAIASHEDGAVWELEAGDPGGVRARQLAIIYGEPPAGFHQITPKDNGHPAALAIGRTYYVAAAGPRSVYRMVFSLPQYTIEAIRGGPIPREPSTRPATP